MKIRLNEIPEDGRKYVMNRQTAELNLVLNDLISHHEYQVDLYIKPLNNKDYTMDGLVKTHLPQQCSRCACDFSYDINAKVKEILIPSQEVDRTGQYIKSSVNFSEDEDVASVSEYSKQLQFDLGEFLHEVIALEVPYNPYCNDCAKNDTQAFIYDEKMGEVSKPNPFQALKGLKLN